MNDLEEVIEVLRDDGWTCEYHEPDSECRVCQRLHRNTAERIIAALSITEDEDPLVVTSADGSQTYFHDRTEDE